MQSDPRRIIAVYAFFKNVGVYGKAALLPNSIGARSLMSAAVVASVAAVVY